MPGDAFNDLGIHAKHKAQCDESFSGDMIGYEFVFWLCLNPL